MVYPYEAFPNNSVSPHLGETFFPLVVCKCVCMSGCLSVFRPSATNRVRSVIPKHFEILHGTPMLVHANFYRLVGQLSVFSLLFIGQPATHL